ncbi:MAG: branched-chain amino acid ABC transporter permease [Armatimonadetes bacterium]|nr:branched-chain amino acid ABC transporter permease [Armatimonadota bacterium]
MSPQRKREILGFALATALVAAVPLITRDAYVLSIGVFIGLYAMCALGLGLLLGFAGQVSLGHAAFYGLGAYGSAILTLHYSWNPWLAMVVAAVGTGLGAYIVGRPTLRLHGHYLAMATLGFGIIMTILFTEGGEFTGGPSGLPGLTNLSFGSLFFSSDLHMYCLIWPLVLLQVLLSRNLLRSRLGRAMRAIHDSEVAARSCAIDTGRLKLAVFVLSAVYASLAGSLYAHTVNFVNPHPFGFKFSIELVLMVVVGGAATLWGPVLGAAALTLLHQALVQVGSLYAPVKDLDVVLFGIILIVMLLFRPQGLAGAFSAWRAGNHGH